MGASRKLEMIMQTMLYRSLVNTENKTITASDIDHLSRSDQMRFA